MSAATVKGRMFAEFINEAMKMLAELEAENAALRKENEYLKSDAMPPILSPRFISGYCGVCPSTVSDWLISGRLNGTKKNGRWLIKSEDFRAWLNDETRLKPAR